MQYPYKPLHRHMHAGACNTNATYMHTHIHIYVIVDVVVNVIETHRCDMNRGELNIAIMKFKHAAPRKYGTLIRLRTIKWQLSCYAI